MYEYHLRINLNNISKWKEDKKMEKAFNNRKTSLDVELPIIFFWTTGPTSDHHWNWSAREKGFEFQKIPS